MDISLETILENCLLQPPGQVEQAIREACAAHPEFAEGLHQRFTLLADAGFLEPNVHAVEFPERLGEFRLLERIGSGGMGVVYRAMQEPLEREVALKLVRPEHLFFPGARTRFQREIETVAKLQHPGIVPIYTFGEASGVPYFAMELIRGATLREILDHVHGRSPESLERRDLEPAIAKRGMPVESAMDRLGRTFTECCLQITMQAAEALQHAHERGVFHRDIKPSNITIDVNARVQLLDFGLAYAEGTTRLTASQTTLGSLHYMPPERLRGNEHVDYARADVYSLGATLYELLTLELPFRTKNQSDLRQAISTGNPRSPRVFNPSLSRDIENVCLKALAREPGRRYADAASFARDLRNLLEFRPVEARRAGPVERTRNWVRRHPTSAVSLIAGFLLVVVAPLIAWQRIRQERDVAVEARVQADRDAYFANVATANLAWSKGEIGLAKRALARCPEALRGWEWRHLAFLADGSSRTVRLVGDTPLGAAWHAPTGLVYWVDGSQTIRGVDPTSGETKWTRTGEDRFCAVAIRGRKLVLGTQAGSIVLWPIGQSSPSAKISIGARAARSIALHGSDALVICGPPEHSGSVAVLLDLDASREIDRFVSDEAHVYTGIWSKNGKRVYLARGKEVWSWKPKEAPQKIATHADKITAFAWAKDQLVGTAVDGSVCVIDVHAGTIVSRKDGRQRLQQIAWHERLQQLMVAGNWRSIGLYRVTPRGLLRICRLHGHTDFVDAVLPTEHGFLTLGDDHLLKTWRPADPAARTTLTGHRRAVQSVCFSSDGGRLYSGSFDGNIGVWEVATERLVEVLHRHRRAACALRLDGSGRLWSASSDGHIFAGAIDKAPGKSEATEVYASESAIADLDIEAGRVVWIGGTRVYWASVEALLSGSAVPQSYEIANPIAIPTGTGPVALHLASAGALSITPDGRRIAIARADGKVTVLVLDRQGARTKSFELSGHRKKVTDVCWSPDGHWLASASKDRRVLVWDTQTRSVRFELLGHEWGISALAFSPDGRRLATAGAFDRTLRIWDVATGRMLLSSQHHDRPLLCVTFSPAGEIIATGGMDHTVVLLRAR